MYLPNDVAEDELGQVWVSGGHSLLVPTTLLSATGTLTSFSSLGAQLLSLSLNDAVESIAADGTGRSSSYYTAAAVNQQWRGAVEGRHSAAFQQLATSSLLLFRALGYLYAAGSNGTLGSNMLVWLNSTGVAVAEFALPDWCSAGHINIVCYDFVVKPSASTAIICCECEQRTAIVRADVAR